VLTGMVMTVLGPVLPVLAGRWRLNDMQSGYLFLAQFASSCLGMLLSGLMVQRWGSRRTLIAGQVMMAFGLALLSRTEWTVGLAAVCIYGLAFGTNTPTVNLFVARAAAPRSASALNLVNSSWGVGAMACPMLVAVAQRQDRVPLFLYSLAATLVILAIALTQVRFRSDEEASTAKPPSHAAANPWLHPMLPLVALLLFTYVGSENCVGGWVASFARRIGSESSTFWAITPSFFWGGLLVGRALAPALLRTLHEVRVAIGGLATAVAGVALLISAHTMTPVVAGAILAGLGFASIFPISLALFPHWLGDAASEVSGAVFAMGNLGGAVLPWVVGAVSTQFSSLRVGLAVPLVGALGMLGFYLTSGNNHPVSERPE
jgi:fucose permease